MIKRIDMMIRLLSQSKPSISAQGTLSSEDILAMESNIDNEDKNKVADLLEDLVVFLRDDPDEKKGINTTLNKITNGYGHIRPISETVKQVKSVFLG